MQSFYAYFAVSAEQAVGQTVELSAIWDVMTLVWRRCNGLCNAKMGHCISLPCYYFRIRRLEFEYSGSIS